MEPENRSAYAQASDADLLKLIQEANKPAFTELMGRHLSNIVNYAYGVMKNTEEAKDVAQDTFVRVWEKARYWKDKGVSVKSWIYRIAYNLCIDRIRKRGRELSDESIEQLESDQSAEQTAADDLHFQLVLDLIQSLPERQATAIQLCSYYGHSNKEAAEVLDISVEALESLLARARRTLRKKLAELNEVTV
jgi:RNA polymerase sigma-70 factor (ECF subfamily)